MDWNRLFTRIFFGEWFQNDEISIQMAELRKKAEFGDPQAQYELGNRYHNGTNVAEDPEAAVHWWQKAANVGHKDAAMMLKFSADNTLPAKVFRILGSGRDD